MFLNAARVFVRGYMYIRIVEVVGSTHISHYLSTSLRSQVKRHYITIHVDNYYRSQIEGALEAMT